MYNQEKNSITIIVFLAAIIYLQIYICFESCGLDQLYFATHSNDLKFELFLIENVIYIW